MSKRLEELQRRKEELIGECAEERFEVAAAFSNVKSSLTLSAALHGLGRILRTHPMIAAGISSLLASGYAGRLTKSGSDLLRLLRFARPLWSWWSARRRREAKTSVAS